MDMPPTSSMRLEGVEVVVIPAGVPRKPVMTHDDLFNTNASIVWDLASAIGRVAPNAHVLVISNPVNSTVPIVASTLAKDHNNRLDNLLSRTMHVWLQRIRKPQHNAKLCRPAYIRNPRRGS
ncbi:hypothetical protein HYDPIDRAFT_34324, partial [Hydnomerulius pinastri MD-312]